MPRDADDRASARAAIERSDVVVGVGGPGGDLEVLWLADEVGKHVVPLRWMGGPIDRFEPAQRESLAVCSTRRFRQILRTAWIAELPMERWLVPLLELADPERARAYQEYTDILAALLRSAKALSQYGRDVMEAALQATLRPRRIGVAPDDLIPRAAAAPAFLFYDLVEISDLHEWRDRDEIREALLTAAARHARPHIADIASAMFAGPAPVIAGTRHELLRAVRREIDDDVAYVEWLRPIVVAWTPVLLAGTVEKSERGHDMVHLLRDIAPRPPFVFSWTLRESAERAERLAEYLWTCAFGSGTGRADALGVAFERELADPDSRGTPWALLWLARALVAELSAMEDDSVTDDQLEHTARIEATMMRLHWYWQEHPDEDPHQRGAPLLLETLRRRIDARALPDDMLRALHEAASNIVSHSADPQSAAPTQRSPEQTTARTLFRYLAKNDLLGLRDWLARLADRTNEPADRAVLLEVIAFLDAPAVA